MKDPWINWLHEVLGNDYAFIRTVPVGGGCINEARKAIGKTNVFIKRNNVSTADEMFRSEESGLDLLRKNARSLIVPKVLYRGTDFEGYHIIILEWIEPGHESKHFWEDFGRGIAELHQQQSDAFGLEDDNFIGKLYQNNRRWNSWADFYWQQRLLPQIDLGVRSGYFEHRMFQQAENLHKIITAEFPEELPSLLHGDLWSGNFIPHQSGKAAIFDPAVYYGNRETEIAFTLLFGGFDNHFYAAYHEVYPLQEGWEERLPVHHLYPLLVHANLFGGGYIRRCVEILDNYN